jgi:hypothetical protein
MLLVDIAAASILVPLFVTWTIATLALAYGAYRVEYVVVDRYVHDPLGPEYWAIVAGGGAAVGGLVALGSVVQNGLAFELVHSVTIVVFSIANVGLVGFARLMVSGR